MKLTIANLPLDCVEFKDRHGVFRRSYGCSLRGLEEFQARIEKIGEIIKAVEDSQATIASLYQNDEVFRQCCDRSLELNNIDPDWMDREGLIIQSLLLTYEGAPGLLVRLNMPEPAKTPVESGKSATVNDLAAVLLSATNDLKTTLDALRNEPAKEVIGILEARAEQIVQADPELKKMRDRRAWVDKRRSDAQTKAKAFKPSELQRVDASAFRPDA